MLRHSAPDCHRRVSGPGSDATESGDRGRRQENRCRGTQAQQGGAQEQITDRYTKAIEQLGAEELEVPLGGIYALERIAVDSKRDHPTIVEVLSAFVRERTRQRPDKPIVAEVPNEPVGETDQAPTASQSLADLSRNQLSMSKPSSPCSAGFLIGTV